MKRRWKIMDQQAAISESNGDEIELDPRMVRVNLSQVPDPVVLNYRHLLTSITSPSTSDANRNEIEAPPINHYGEIKFTPAFHPSQLSQTQFDEWLRALSSANDNHSD
jgi:hypothetical protein